MTLELYMFASFAMSSKRGLQFWMWVVRLKVGKKKQTTPFWPHHDRWDWGIIAERISGWWFTVMTSRYFFHPSVNPWLVDVGGLEHEWIMTFHSVGNFILPTDVHSMIFQRGRSTTNHIWCGKYDDFPIQMGDGRAFNPEEWWIQQARCGFRWLELRRDILSIRFTDSLGINTLGIQPNADLQEPMWMGIEKHPERWISSKTRFYRNHMQIFVHGDIHTKSHFARKTDVEKLPTDVFCRVILANDLCQETWSMPRNMENSINKTNHLNQVFLYPFQYFWYTKWISIPQWPFQEPKLEVPIPYIRPILNTHWIPFQKKNNQQACVFGSTLGNGHWFHCRYCFHPSSDPCGVVDVGGLEHGF